MSRGLGDVYKRQVYVSLATCVAAVAAAAPAGGPSASTATVSLTANGKDLPLKREEQIALMFLTAISTLEDDCVRHVGRACSLDELVNGGVQAPDNWRIAHLKFDPRATDPAYTYTLNATEKNWEVIATAKKPGFGGFYVARAGFGFAKLYYDAKGEASNASTRTDGYSIAGDSFVAS